MSSMTLVRRIAASPDTVFDLLSTAEGIAQWWGPDDGPVLLSEFDARVGGRFRLRFRMRNGSEHEVHGEVLELARPSRLVTSWNWLENEGEPASRLEMTLRAIDDGCELVFTHALLPDEATARGHEKGWSGSLDKLQSAVDRHASSGRSADRPLHQEG
ncbi:SRPBCC domain-containing protein [Burkholderiaceae bacterium UC74_6]